MKRTYEACKFVMFTWRRVNLKLFTHTTLEKIDVGKF
jgi:hypothetical protein